MIDKFANIDIDIKQEHFNKLNAYRESLFVKPQLQQLFIEMTLNCNEHCLHCGSECGMGVEVDTPLSDYEILGFLSHLKSQLEARNESLPFLDITGGEPLLRRNLVSLMKDIHDLGYRWGMTSNGLLIDDSIARSLKDAGMYSIAISLDGTRDTHNWFRQNEKAYDLAIRAMKALSGVGFGDVMVTTCVHKRNIDELDSIKDIVKDTGVNTWRIVCVDPIGRALENNDLLLDSSQYKRMVDYIVSLRENDKDINVIYDCNYYLGLNYERKTRPWYFLCQAGLKVASIQYNGNITACLDIERRPELVYGNIRHDDFLEVWNTRFEHFRRNREDLSSKCKDCSDKGNCHGGGFHTWDFDNNEPRVCMFESLRC